MHSRREGDVLQHGGVEGIGDRHNQHAGPGDASFEEYPDESIAAWHERLGLEE